MLLAFWEDGGWQNAAIVAAIILIAYALVMWVGALVWTYRDMQARSRDPFTQVVAVLVVLVFNLPGIMLYMVLRPKETLAELYDRQLGSEALLHEIHDQPTCPACRRKIDTDFMTCPYCRTALRVPCASCEKALMSTWILCPYCGADRSLPAAPNIVAVRAPIAAPALGGLGVVGVEPCEVAAPLRGPDVERDAVGGHLDFDHGCDSIPGWCSRPESRAGWWAWWTSGGAGQTRSRVSR